MQKGTKRVAILALIILSAAATLSTAQALYLLWPSPNSVEFCATPRADGLTLGCVTVSFLLGIRYLLGRLKNKSAV
jgi:hypothetical protein